MDGVGQCLEGTEGCTDVQMIGWVDRWMVGDSARE